MKRLLIVFTLLAALLAPQMALADSFKLGGTNEDGTPIFNDSWSLEDTIANLESVYGASFSKMTSDSNRANDVVKTGMDYIYTGIGYSAAAREMELALKGFGRSNSTWANFRSDNEYAATDLTFSYLQLDPNRTIKVGLSAMLDGSSPYITINDVYRLNNDLTLYLNGDADPFVLKAGTLFFAFSIPGSGNNIDFIMTAYSPSTPVPVPAAMWLFGSGLAGLVTLRRKLR